MTESQINIKANFDHNAKEFEGWENDMIIGYYMQFGFKYNVVKEALGF